MLHEDGSSYATWVAFRKQDLYSGGPGIKFLWLRHWPPTFPEEIVTYVMKNIRAVREAGGVVNTAIVIGAALVIVRRMKPELLECNGGHVVLPVKKDWAKYLLAKK